MELEQGIPWLEAVPAGEGARQVPGHSSCRDVQRVLG